MSEPETEFNAQFFEQFLDDYFAEADEHLRALRRNLLDLEDTLSSGEPLNKALLDELFRSFHTLKGISAMAGVSLAEAMAHTLESYLRLLRDGKARLSENGLTALIAGTRKIEDIVTAKKSGGEMPSIADETKILETIADETGPGHEPAEMPDDPRHEPGASQYLFTFTSAAELAQRGVDVSSVRKRLQDIGTIISSTPTVLESGHVAFQFVVETDKEEREFESWSADGIAFELLRHVDSTQPGPVTAESARSPISPSSNVVRVDLSRLDDLMVMLGELVVSRAKLSEQIKQIDEYLPSELMSSLAETDHAMELQLRDMRDGVLRTRMNPIGEVFERLEFAVRDLARESGKKVRLEITGENTEIDKMLVEKVLDPLMHLVRNAVSHGIESAAERKAKNKPAAGIVKLRAETIGETIVLEIADDGRGIDVAAVRKRAIEEGLIDPGLADDGAMLLDILSTPGFSTRTEADKASGRGVGMDVVRRAVDDLNGTISMETKADVGTTFRIQFPLTLAIADALIVMVDEQRFAVPQAGVNEVIEVQQSSVSSFENNEVIDYRGISLPLIRLSALFQLQDRYRDVFHAFVVGEGRQAVGIAVDKVIGQSEIVIRSIDDSLIHVPGISGATELGDGKIILILDTQAVSRRFKHAV